jgi:hypothetical protein
VQKEKQAIAFTSSAQGLGQLPARSRAIRKELSYFLMLTNQLRAEAFGCGEERNQQRHVKESVPR